MAEDLAYKRKALLRGKNRKVRIEQVSEIENLLNADRDARKRKSRHKGVIEFDKDRDGNIAAIKRLIDTETYHTSPGHECVRHCPCGKDRVLHKLPYYPDHIVHHALMKVIFPVLMRYYYYDSSASIPGKGIHFAAKRTKRWIDENKDAGRLYYAKIDFVKFYHLIIQQKIYDHLCRIFGNNGIRYLVHEVVTACDEGLGIGLYPIQPFANAYTCPLCRLLMEKFKVRVEIYCDDLVIMSRDKKQLWKAINLVKNYAKDVMEQPLHDNIGIQIIDERHCLDFVGYQFFFGHTLLRDKMKRKFKQRMSRSTDEMKRYRSATSYKGWLMHCNGYNLWCRVMGMKSFKELCVPKFEKLDSEGKRMLEGTRVSASIFVDREVVFLDAEIGVKSKFNDKPSAVVQIEDNGRKYKFFTNNKKLIHTIQYVKEHDGFPFRGTLVRANTSGLPDYEIQ